jgi:uncharacterized protein (DUF1778 family)
MSLSVEEKRPAAKTERIGLRTTLQQQVLIQRAADALQKSVTEFILDSACKAAENTLLEQRLFLLDEEAWDKFVEILDRPVSVNTGLRELLKEKAPWE